MGKINTVCRRAIRSIKHREWMVWKCIVISVSDLSLIIKNIFFIREKVLKIFSHVHKISIHLNIFHVKIWRRDIEMFVRLFPGLELIGTITRFHSNLSYIYCKYCLIFSFTKRGGETPALFLSIVLMWDLVKQKLSVLPINRVTHISEAWVLFNAKHMTLLDTCMQSAYIYIQRFKKFLTQISILVIYSILYRVYVRFSIGSLQCLDAKFGYTNLARYSCHSCVYFFLVLKIMKILVFALALLNGIIYG